MTERIVRTSVQFCRSFRLSGIDELLPPGTYEIETVEEQIDSLSIVGWRRISTAITVQGPTTLSRQLTSIDPADLAAALGQDRINGNDRT
jgi:hypothetical protein